MNGEEDHPLVDLQMKEMVGNIEPRDNGRKTDLLDLSVLVETRSARYRLMLNIAFSWFGQFSGNKLVPTSTVQYSKTCANHNLQYRVLLPAYHARGNWNHRHEHQTILEHRLLSGRMGLFHSRCPST